MLVYEEWQGQDGRAWTRRGLRTLRRLGHDVLLGLAALSMVEIDWLDREGRQVQRSRSWPLIWIRLHAKITEGSLS